MNTNKGRPPVRHWAILLATSGQFRDRLWAGSHGRRQSAPSAVAWPRYLGAKSPGGRSGRDGKKGGGTLRRLFFLLRLLLSHPVGPKAPIEWLRRPSGSGRCVFGYRRHGASSALSSDPRADLLLGPLALCVLVFASRRDPMIDRSLPGVVDRAVFRPPFSAQYWTVVDSGREAEPRASFASGSSCSGARSRARSTVQPTGDACRAASPPTTRALTLPLGDA